MPRLEAIFEPKFIHDSFACRVGKGTHAAVERLQHFMNSVTHRGQKTAWFMQLDIRSFFMSIDREILIAILQRQVRDKNLQELAARIIRNDCTHDFVYKGDPRLMQMIPPHKSMFHIPEGKGLPIGNLTSQFFGNVYLNELDQFVKHTLKAPHYLRYVDDFVLLHQSREALVAYREQIEEFLTRRLQLELKEGDVLKRVSEGADFLGYIVRPDYLLARNRVVGNLRSRVRMLREEIEETPLAGIAPHIHLHLHEEPVRHLRQRLASYLGHLKHANARQLTRSIFEKSGYLNELFKLDVNDYSIKPRFEPEHPPANLKEQYNWGVKTYSEQCVFIQVGRFCELHGEQAERYGKGLGLTLQKDQRTGRVKCGFPMRLLKSFKKRARLAGIPYIVLGERGYYPSGLKKRVITELFRLKRSVS